MCRFITLLFSLFTLQQLSAQGIREYVIQQTKPIYSIDGQDTRTDDLEKIGEAIGDADVVLLGEQDHGDAPTFKAKERIIRYLHQQKGFSVIAFESDFYGLISGQQAVNQHSRNTFQLMKKNIFSLWTKTQECEPLFRYIDSASATIAPLTITGFDNQLHGAYRISNYQQEVTQLLQSVNSRWVDSIQEVLMAIQQYYPLHYGNGFTVDTLARYKYLVESVNRELSVQPDSMYVKILLQSLLATIDQGYYFLQKNFRSMTVRDQQMAANLLWLRKYKYPGRKIIVWAHNYHIAKHTQSAFPPESGRHLSMGNELYRALKDSMYVLGFTSYRGKAGRLGAKTIKLPKPKKESMEQWMATHDPDFSFVDLKSYRQAHPGTTELFFMKGKQHTNAKARWVDVFDGVFYIRDMYRATAL